MPGGTGPGEQTKLTQQRSKKTMAVDKTKPLYQIKVLDVATLGSIDASFLVNKYKPGEKMPVPTYSYLILGENIPPILVDTGVKESMLGIMARLGMTATQSPEQTYAAQLAKWDLKIEDIKIVLHTHLHIDHSGNDDYFTNAKIIMPRKELMCAVADLMDAQYPPEYITYLVEQIHVPGKVRLIDDEQELYPGILLEPTEAHSWGSMNIHVNTSLGRAIICGDVIYDETLQCRQNDIFTEVTEHAKRPGFPFGDRSTGNYWNLWAAKAGVQKVMATADVVLPIHDSLVVQKYGYEIG
jgi:glyoxylase-like metal-dependent hydrolase (beta-lactamase superfamily II)